MHAGHRLANQQAPARLITGQRSGPAFDVIYAISTRHPRFTYVRLQWVTPDALKGTPYPATLATTTLYRSNLRVVCGLPLQGDHGGPPDKTAVRPLHLSHDTASRTHWSFLLPVALSAFVAHLLLCLGLVSLWASRDRDLRGLVDLQAVLGEEFRWHRELALAEIPVCREG